MFKPESKIGAISTFLQQLDKIDRSGNRVLFFRGHSKASFQPKPSIFRNPGWIANEATMLKELILRCPNDFVSGLTTFQCLVKMQHYGLPTRLLDITSNPLVALHFACEMHEKNEEDGEVIVFGYDIEQIKYFDSDTVSVVANLSRRPFDFEIPDTEEVSKFNSHKSIELLLHDIKNDKPHFGPKILRTDLARVLCVKPKLDNPRIIRQEGAFLLFGCEQSKEEPAKLGDETIIGKLTINRNEKANLLGQLRTLGISRATMFPEIEQVAAHIKYTNCVPTFDVSASSMEELKVFSALRKSGDASVETVAKLTDLKPVSAKRVISELTNRGVIVGLGSGRNKRWTIAKRVEIVNEIKVDERGEIPRETCA